MPAVQISYNEVMRPAVEGMIADTTPQTILSRIVESAAGIGFGKVATKGTGDRQVMPAPGGVFMGITVLDTTVQHVSAPVGSPDFYPDRDVCNVIIQGCIWVLASAAVTAGEPAYYVPADGTITNVATGNTAIPGGRFESSAASGALVKLRMI